MHIIQIDASHHVYHMDRSHPPAITVESGDRLRVLTMDCYNDQVTPDPASHGRIDQPHYNPATGPIGVHKAAPGDVLCVEVEAIDVRPYGIVTVRPQGGGARTKMGVQRVSVPQVTQQGVQLDAGALLPVRPMIGVIGVAPSGDPVSTEIPGDHGGNMDVKEIGPGTRVYLPVQVTGALLALGDVHALMGDGELSGTGVEVAASVHLRVELHAQVHTRATLRRPLVETPDRWIFVASAPTLDEAVGLAVDDAVDALARLSGAERARAYMWVGLLGDLGVAQVVNPWKTAKVSFRKDDLARLPFFHGTFLPR